MVDPEGFTIEAMQLLHQADLCLQLEMPVLA